MGILSVEVLPLMVVPDIFSVELGAGRVLPWIDSVGLLEGNSDFGLGLWVIAGLWGIIMLGFIVLLAVVGVELRVEVLLDEGVVANKILHDLNKIY